MITYFAKDFIIIQRTNISSFMLLCLELFPTLHRFGSILWISSISNFTVTLLFSYFISSSLFPQKMASTTIEVLKKFLDLCMYIFHVLFFFIYLLLISSHSLIYGNYSFLSINLLLMCQIELIKIL